jgi:hypothetical protein
MGGLTDVIESSVSKLAKLVLPVAPILGGVLGSPVAGIALSILSAAFGGSAKDAGDILNHVVAAPDREIKLRELEDQHCENLAHIASTDYQTEVADRTNARATNAVLYKDFLRHMAYLVTVGFFGVLLLLFLPVHMEGTEKDLLLMLVGMLASKWQTIIDFFYGSSRKQGASHG